MSFCGRFVLLGALAVLALLGSARAAGADVIHVKPGESIQAAIDGASPGDTIKVAQGTYHENIAITKNDITLRGAGPSRVRLRPAETPTPNICSFEEEGVLFIDGICVAGAFDPETFEPGDPVVGTTITGFDVKGFNGFGVILLNANDSTVKRVWASFNGGYGISGFFLSGVRFQWNIAHHNGEPGFYVGDSPEANALVSFNRAFKNGPGLGFGMLFRDSSMGVVHHNRVWGNCVGMVFLDAGFGEGPASDWFVHRNRVRTNNEACEEGPFPASGTGLLLLGTDHVTVARNRVFDHAPSIESLHPGGIVLASAAPFGGPDPTDNAIRHNVAFGNEPADVVWDGSGSGNRFPKNRCGTSDPPWICD